MGERVRRAFLRVFNGSARVLGGLCLIVSLAFVAAGVLASGDRGVNLVAGAFLLVTGTAFLAVKPATQKQLERIRGIRPREDSADRRGPDDWQA